MNSFSETHFKEWRHGLSNEGYEENKKGSKEDLDWKLRRKLDLIHRKKEKGKPMRDSLPSTLKFADKRRRKLIFR